MKKLIIMLSVYTSVSLYAQNQNSLLWEISGLGLENKSYLFGTIHMIPQSDYFFTQAMEQAFNQCNSLVIEADLFSLSFADKINLTTQVLLPKDSTLHNYMDSAAYCNLKKFLSDSIGISEKKFDKKYNRFKPFFLSAIFLQQYVGKTKTYEEELYTLSKKNIMELKALETIQFQMDLTNTLTIDEQIEGMSDMEQYKIYFQMLEFYKQQNLDSLYTISVKEYQTPSDQTFLKRFVNDRNANWIPKIELMINQNSCFVAVGAMHLSGSSGLIELLKQKGYLVTPILK